MKTNPLKTSILMGLFSLTTSLWGYGQALEAKPEKVLIGIGAQYNLPARYFNSDINKFDDRNAGVGFYVEPKLLKCSFLLGLKAEYAVVQENFQTDAIMAYNIVSLSPTAKYLFCKRQNTPFVGFGTGLYYVSNVENKLNWGIEPSAGYLFHKVQLSLNYNRILNKIETNGGGFNNYYLALKLGVEL
jgi:hypothetical protein